jgi:hypothetical protein
MKPENKFVIVDLRTQMTLYGVKSNVLRFSTRDIAEEVAEQFFTDSTHYVILNAENLGI